MPNILSKTVNFYELKVLNKGKPDESLQIDWHAELEKWAAKPFSEHYVGELHCSPELGYDLPILCIHRPINEKYKTTVDREKESIDDASKAIETVSWRLSESSVFIFIPGSTTVGVVKAGKSSPGKDPLLAFLNELLPPLDGAYWDMVPIISAGQEKRFKETKKGVTALEFTTIMSPQPDLLAPPEKDSLFGTFEKLSAEIAD